VHATNVAEVCLIDIRCSEVLKEEDGHCVLCEVRLSTPAMFTGKWRCRMIDTFLTWTVDEVEAEEYHCTHWMGWVKCMNPTASVHSVVMTLP
jgi:hypothetical protein